MRDVICVNLDKVYSINHFYYEDNYLFAFLDNESILKWGLPLKENMILVKDILSCEKKQK